MGETASPREARPLVRFRALRSKHGFDFPRQKADGELLLLAPTHKRAEGRALEWGSVFTTKCRYIKGGFSRIGAYAKLKTRASACLRASQPPARFSSFCRKHRENTEL